MHAPLPPSPPIAAYLDIRTARRPAWAPDGAGLAYLSDESGFAQIWSLPAEGGAPRRLTFTEEPVASFAYDPAGKRIVFLMDCGGDERFQLLLLDPATGAVDALTEDPTVCHVWGAWSPDGTAITYASNARDRRHMDVYVMDMATRTARRVLEGEGWREPVAFLPGGGALVVREAARAMTDQDLLRLDLATGEVVPLLPRGGPARYPAVRARKDGSGLVLATDRRRDFLGLAVLDLAGGGLEWVSAPEGCDVEAIAVAPDQRRIAYTVNEAGWSRLRVHDLDTRAEIAIEGLPEGTIETVAWSPDGARLAFGLDGASSPGDIWSWDSQTGAVARLTEAARMPAGLPALVEPTVLATESFDGLAVPSFVYRPAEPPPAAAGYPAVIVVHGGPESQWTPGFRADVQWMVARGILVVAPNVRGSTGYGRNYMSLDDREKRLDSVADLEAVARRIAAEPEVDAGRIAVFGRSYGGFMVLSAMTEYPDLWKAGIEFYGIASFRSFLLTTGPWRRHLRAAEYGDLPEMEAELERFSPINRIDRIAAPLFIAQGLDDPRVPPGESEMVFSCLRGLGREVEYLRIPHEGHGFARIENRHAVFGALAAFLDRHL